MKQNRQNEQDQTHGEADAQAAAHAPVQATCGVCGQVLDPEVDDLYVELCRQCESAGLKGRQTRTRVRAPHPRRF